MQITKQELVVYFIIALIVVVVVAYYATQYLNQSISVSVKLQSLTSPRVLYPYDVALLKLYVNNTGSRPISGLLVGAYVDGQELRTYTVNIPAGAGLQINLSYIYPQSGPYTFEATADPGQLFDIENRASATAAITFNVTKQQSPDVYTTLPNNNITSSQTYSLAENGTDEVLFMSAVFNFSILDNSISSENPVLMKVYEELSPYIYHVNAAQVLYSNMSRAEVAWAQGTVNSSVIESVVAPNALSTKSIKNGAGFFAKLSNSTSMCVFYDQGWTKILQFSNVSNGPTCLNIVNATYNATENGNLVTVLKTEPELTAYQANFIYINSTNIGSGISIVNNSPAVINFFQNKYGFFASRIARTNSMFNINANITCHGFVFAFNGVDACTTGVIPELDKNVSLINSTEINNNYTVNLYSLVAENYSLIAQQSSASLISLLNLPGPDLRWASTFKSTCALNENSLGCSILNFTASDNATIKITNHYPSPIGLDSVSCLVPGLHENQTQALNSTLGPNQSIVLNTICNGTIPGLYTSINFLYNITLNYTLNNIQTSARGTASMVSPYV